LLHLNRQLEKFFAMRKILMLLVFVFATYSYAKTQDTLTSYFDKDWNIIPHKENADFYRKEYFDIGKKLWVVNDYYMSGQIQMIGSYESQKKEVKHGLFTYYSEENQVQKEENFMRGVFHGQNKSWYENGNPYEFINYRYGKKQGELVTHWRNGQLRRKDVFENNELESGTVWDSLGNEVDYYHYMTMPEFPGGQHELFRFISRNVKYPRRAQYNKIYGKVLLQFIVAKDGSIQNIEVIESVHKLLDEEAIRVIQKLPKWKPGTKEGEAVYVRYQVPINFKSGY
jgi:TonB family protein